MQEAAENTVEPGKGTTAKCQSCTPRARRSARPHSTDASGYMRPRPVRKIRSRIAEIPSAAGPDPLKGEPQGRGLASSQAPEALMHLTTCWPPPRAPAADPSTGRRRCRNHWPRPRAPIACPTPAQGPKGQGLHLSLILGRGVEQDHGEGEGADDHLQPLGERLFAGESKHTPRHGQGQLGEALGLRPQEELGVPLVRAPLHRAS